MQKNQKKCIICGKMFCSPPSSKTVTCSMECRKKYAKLRSTGRIFSEASRKKSSEAARGRDMTSLQKIAVEAARKSPNSGPFESNVNAKMYILKSPDKQIYICKNLKLWVRNNCSLFDLETSERNIANISSGLRQALSGKRTSTYKCWECEHVSDKYSEYFDIYEKCTKAQREILNLKFQGMSNIEIAKILGYSYQDIHEILESIKNKNFK